MANGDCVDLRQAVHAFEGLQHTAGVGAHQAVVVEAEVRSDRSGVAVEDVVGAVVEAEGIAGVEDAGAVIKGKDRVWPVQVRSTEEFEAMLDAALRVGSKIQLLAGLHRAGFEGPVHLILQELQRHLRADDLNVGVEVNQVTDQSGVIRFGVAHDQHIDGCGLLFRSNKK